MKPILDLFAESYYTLPVLIVCQIVAAIVGYYRKNNFRELKNFHLYPIASLCQTICALIAVSCLDGKMEVRLMETSTFIFVLFEVLLLYTLFFNVIKTKNFKLVLKISLFAFFVYTISVYVFTGEFYWNIMKVIMGETCIILVSVCLYFIELFRLPPTFSIIGQPAFWIITGILFAFGCTLPVITLSFFALGMVSDSYLYSINFIGYSTLFLFVTRGYLCRKETIFQVTQNMPYSKIDVQEEVRIGNVFN